MQNDFVAFRVTLHLAETDASGAQVIVLRCRLPSSSELSMNTIRDMIAKQAARISYTPSIEGMNWRYLDEDEALVDLMADDDLQEALTLHKMHDIPIFKLHLMPAGTKIQLDCLPPVSVKHSQRSSRLVSPETTLGSGNGHSLVAQSLLQDTVQAHQKVAKNVIDRWLKQMPETYFREIDSETRMTHLRALIALQIAGQPQEISMFSKESSIYTIIKPQNYIGLLSEVIHNLPKDRRLREANIYTSVGADALVIDVFEFENPAKLAEKFDSKRSLAHSERFEYLTQSLREYFESNDVEFVEDVKWSQFVKSCDEQYIMRTDFRLIFQHFELVCQAQLHESIVTSMDPSESLAAETLEQGVFEMERLHDVEEATKLTVVTKTDESGTHDFVFHRIVHYLGRSSVDIDKAKLGRVDGFFGSNYVVLTCFLRLPDGKPVNKESVLAQQICGDILRLPFLDETVLLMARQMNTWRVADVELISVLGRLIHCIASESRPLVYTHYHIDKFLNQYPDILRSILRLWEIKFAPLSKSSLSSRHPVITEIVDQIRVQIDRTVELEDCKIFYQLAMHVVMCTHRTNFYLARRISFAIRLEPSILRVRDQLLSSVSLNTTPASNQTQGPSIEEPPFGIFFVCGRGFCGFHVRFRDISRGGIKIAVPASTEQYSLTQRTVLSECVELARVQQLKNKDIPEGGSKAIIVVQPSETNVDAAVKATIDGLLDLVCPETDVTSKRIIDYYGEQEVLFLGPGELVTNETIAWICDRANARLCPYANTFMSSKPGNGINHVEYAVNPEGIAVFLDVALRHCGIDPNQQSFTVKLTGSPGEDLTGNLIKILVIKYGANVKFVAIADSFGVAEDPQGLDHSELLRLASSFLSIAEFSKRKLSIQGGVISSQDPSGSGIKARNSMHFRVQSDVFIPAGGRSMSINDSNWRQFLLPDGRAPSSSIIVEGVNSFLTHMARLQLSHAGVVVINDSSATKCNVICSSYEVLASMLLDEKEFSEIKKQYVKEVQQRFRLAAQVEAEILFKEFHISTRSMSAESHTSIRGRTLPELSMMLSKAIHKIKDAIVESGHLDVYIQPLEEQFRLESVPSVSSKPFFVGSQSSTPATSPIESSGTESSITLYFQQARVIGFEYNAESHRMCRELLLNYIPQSLRDRGKDTRIDSLLPVSYRKQIVATALACKIIYTEGVSFLEGTLGIDILGDTSFAQLSLARQEHNRKIAQWSFKYMSESKRIAELIHIIMKNESSLDANVRQWIVRVLEKGGTRIGIELSQ